jgi:hypothetical protein
MRGFERPIAESAAVAKKERKPNQKTDEWII